MPTGCPADSGRVHRALSIPLSEGNYETGTYGASWMLLSHDKEILKIKEITEAAAPKPDDIKEFPLWTDNYSNLFKYLK